MNSKIFNELSFDEKADTLLTLGKYFDERVLYGKSIFKYYYLQEFVVEVEYGIADNAILNISSFSSVPLIS